MCQTLLHFACHQFEIENGAMVDLRKKYQYYNLDDKVENRIRGPISEFDEILSIFFKNYNIIVYWINCNGSFGSIDNLTGKWTGAVGQVNIYSLFIYVLKELNLRGGFKECYQI